MILIAYCIFCSHCLAKLHCNIGVLFCDGTRQLLKFDFVQIHLNIFMLVCASIFSQPSQDVKIDLLARLFSFLQFVSVHVTCCTKVNVFKLLKKDDSIEKLNGKWFHVIFLLYSQLDLQLMLELRKFVMEVQTLQPFSQSKIVCTIQSNTLHNKLLIWLYTYTYMYIYR